jgi:hypothetical protein
MDDAQAAVQNDEVVVGVCSQDDPGQHQARVVQC